MMQKLMSYKKIIICACAAVAVIAVIAVAVIVLVSNKEETYRSILVYDVEGNAVIERENVGAMNAVENLYLESGDRVSVASDSGMRMKLDDDKYVMAEADTIFSVEAEGTDADSRTKICLEQGAITNEIQNPLSEGSRFETATPNSVMAVRGTIYRVELEVDENGNQNTKLCCFQGKVETTPILPDGTSGEAVLVPAGSELIIHNDGTADDVRDIVYEELPEQAIQNLVSLLESGQTMEGITLEVLDELMNDTTDIREESEKSESEQTVSADTGENSAQADRKSAVTMQTTKKQSEQKPVTKEETQSTVRKEEVKPAVTKPVNAENSGSDNEGEDSSQSGDNSGFSDNGNESDNNEGDADIPNSIIPTPPAPPATYTVTFEYDGKTFATQTVKDGEKAAEPKLVPAQNGEWDFDFGTEIKADTTISWK